MNRCFNQAHSLYLQFTFEYGLPGLLLLLAFVWGLVRSGLSRRGRDNMATLGLALFAFMLVSAVANYYVIFLRPGVFWIVFWLPAGMLMAMSCRERAGIGGNEAGRTEPADTTLLHGKFSAGAGPLSAPGRQVDKSEPQEIEIATRQAAERAAS
ncbi:hypothetical protein D9M68_835380 [compost metagenome]